MKTDSDKKLCGDTSNREFVAEIAKSNGDSLLERQPVTGFTGTIYLGQKCVYKVVEDATRIDKGDLVKAEFVLNKLVTEQASLESYLPTIVGKYTSPANVLVLACRRLEGEHPSILGAEAVRGLGQFLANLHYGGTYDKITEFSSESFKDLKEYCDEKVPSFVKKLASFVSDDDLRLINDACDRIKRDVESIEISRCSLLHKDLHLENLLVDPETGALTGVLDWDAAQTGPPEWEFAIIKQRFPDQYLAVKASYRERIDEKCVDLCGLVQALRFWKSFPTQADFVNEQREYIRKILQR